MKWRDFVKDYFNFSKRERIAVIIVVIVILITLFLPSIIPTGSKNNTPPDTSWFSALKKLELKEAESEYEKINEAENPSNYQFDRRENPNANYTKSEGELFYFDPNTATKEEWKRLGLSEKTLQTIQNYLNKGGRFIKPDDLQKIYGLRSADYERLLPFIKIKNPEINQAAFDNTEKIIESTPPKSNTGKYSVIEINTADTNAYISLPGIGSKLAARIINFREKLGGFYSIEQVGETYGLPDSTFQKIKLWLKLENNSVKKININTATVDELKAHPYIKYSLANPIVAYRNEHGLFTKIEDIKKVMAVADAVYNKIAPYLDIQ